MSQHLERFDAAVQVLIGEGTVKQRLTAAYSEFLEDVLDLELPAGAAGALGELHAALHRVAPVGKETAVKASVQKMSASEAAWHAQTIMRLYAQLLAQPRRPGSLRLMPASAAAPPRFVVGNF